MFVAVSAQQRFEMVIIGNILLILDNNVLKGLFVFLIIHRIETTHYDNKIAIIRFSVAFFFNLNQYTKGRFSVAVFIFSFVFLIIIHNEWKLHIW